MPPWAESVLTVLGDARVISLAALVLALLSFRRSSRLTDLQTRIADLELKNKERAEASREKADIRARLYNTGQYSHRLEVSNRGGATADAVDIEFLDLEEDSLLPQGERRDKLPIPHLEPDESATLVVALAIHRCPPFKHPPSWNSPTASH